MDDARRAAYLISLFAGDAEVKRVTNEIFFIAVRLRGLNKKNKERAVKLIHKLNAERLSVITMLIGAELSTEVKARSSNTVDNLRMQGNTRAVAPDFACDGKYGPKSRKYSTNAQVATNRLLRRVIR